MMSRETIIAAVTEVEVMVPCMTNVLVTKAVPAKRGKKQDVKIEESLEYICQ